MTIPESHPSPSSFAPFPPLCSASPNPPTHPKATPRSQRFAQQTHHTLQINLDAGLLALSLRSVLLLALLLRRVHSSLLLLLLLLLLGTVVVVVVLIAAIRHDWRVPLREAAAVVVAVGGSHVARGDVALAAQLLEASGLLGRASDVDVEEGEGSEHAEEDDEQDDQHHHHGVHRRVLLHAERPHVQRAAHLSLTPATRPYARERPAQLLQRRAVALLRVHVALQLAAHRVHVRRVRLHAERRDHAGGQHRHLSAAHRLQHHLRGAHAQRLHALHQRQTHHLLLVGAHRGRGQACELR